MMRRPGMQAERDAGSVTRRFSTRSLPPRDRFEAWRSHIADTTDLSPAEASATDFPAESEQWSLGDIVFSRYRLSEAPERIWTHWPQSHRDDWCVVLAGPSGARAQGSLSFRALSKPFEGRGRDDEVLTVLLPRNRCVQETRELDSAHDRRIVPGMAALLADFLDSLARNLPAMTQAEADALAESTRMLVRACTVPSRDSIEAADAPINSLMLERARQIVRQNIALPGFGPTQLCRLLAVSRSKLYRLFEASGGVAAFIQRERLHLAMGLLSDQGELRSVNVIASEVGFADHSTFSRAFRREFGLSPSEAREMALARRLGGSAGPANASPASGDPASGDPARA